MGVFLLSPEMLLIASLEDHSRHKHNTKSDRMYSTVM